MSWARIEGGDAASMGTRRFLKEAFSFSGIGLACVKSSAGAHPLVMRFFR